MGRGHGRKHQMLRCATQVRRLEYESLGRAVGRLHVNLRGVVSNLKAGKYYRVEYVKGTAYRKKRCRRR